MNRKLTIRFPVFSGLELRVVFSRDVKRTGARLQSDLDGARGGFVPNVGQSIGGWYPGVFGWFVLESAPDAATVAHEASHAVRALFRHVGVPAAEETLAYHLDYVVGKIHAFDKRTR